MTSKSINKPLIFLVVAALINLFLAMLITEYTTKFGHNREIYYYLIALGIVPAFIIVFLIALLFRSVLEKKWKMKHLLIYSFCISLTILSGFVYSLCI